MPIYLYTHEKDKTNNRVCTHPWEFELDHNIKNDALTVCPECGRPVKRLVAGGVSVKWKGGYPTSKTYT